MFLLNLISTVLLTQSAWADRAVVDSFSGKPKAFYVENNEAIQIKKNQQFEKD